MVYDFWKEKANLFSWSLAVEWILVAKGHMFWEMCISWRKMLYYISLLLGQFSEVFLSCFSFVAGLTWHFD